MSKMITEIALANVIYSLDGRLFNAQKLLTYGITKFHHHRE